MKEQGKIAIIGAGHMGVSLIRGLLLAGVLPTRIQAAHYNLEKITQLKDSFGIKISDSNIEAADNARIVILCVKPQKVSIVIEEMKDLLLTQRPLLISVAAGVSTQFLEKLLGSHLSIVRAMPNIPVMIGAGATGLYANGLVSDAEKSIAESVFRSVGLAVWTEHEKDLNIITALSGSGPAYVYYLMDAMEKAAVGLGLTQELAQLLTLQTVFGATKLALEQKQPLALLQKQVMSPKGTTKAALDVLEQNQVSQVISIAIQEAAARAEKMMDS